MSKRSVAKENAPNAYKDMKGRKICLIFGLVFCALGFAAALLGMLMTFVPAVNIPIDTITPLRLLIYIFAISCGVSFLGVVCAVAGANTSAGLARLSFFLGIVAFIVCAAMLVICVFFNTVLPVDALNRLLGA